MSRGFNNSHHRVHIFVYIAGKVGSSVATRMSNTAKKQTEKYFNTLGYQPEYDVEIKQETPATAVGDGCGIMYVYVKFTGLTSC